MKWKIRGTLFPTLDVTVESVDETPQKPPAVQVSLDGLEVPIVPKRKRGRPKGSLKKKFVPPTPQQIWKLKHELFYMDDQLVGMSKRRAWEIINDYEARKGGV